MIPKAVGSLYHIMIDRNWVPTMKNADLIMFSAAMGIVMVIV